MRKFGKLLTTLAVVGGAAAGAYAIYKKYFATDADCEDIDEDFEDEFEEDFEDCECTKREYVPLTPAAAESAEATECIKEEEPIDPVDHAPADSAEAPVEYSQEEIAEKQVALAEAATTEMKDANE